MSARSDRVRVIEQAEKYVRAGRVKEAIAEYEKLALSDPQDVGTLNIIGDLYIRLGHDDRAVRSFQKVAEEYERRGLFSQALAICKKIHKLEPANADFALKLGDLYAQQGFVADAKNVYAAVAGLLAQAGKAPEAAPRGSRPARGGSGAPPRRPGSRQAAALPVSDVARAGRRG